MSNENKSSWGIDLDSEEAQESIEGLKKGLGDIGATEFSELITAITEVGTVVGVVGVALLAVKEVFDLVFDAENIESVNQQFTVLSKNAGIFGDSMKQALEESAGGLVDETSLLKGASEAMVGLGANSAKLPEVMTLARQATAVFGGDLMQNFNGISQAITTGNTRMLKHLGIVVDAQAAYENYAKSIGVTVDELSEAGKQHALMNAVLEKGKTAFAGVDLNVKQATNAWQMFKVAMVEIGDAIAIAYTKIFGPAVISAIKLLGDTTHYVANALKISFGSPTEAAAASVENLTKKLETLTARQAMLTKDAAGAKLYDPALLASTNKQIADITAQLGKQKEVVKDLAATTDQSTAKSEAIRKQASAADDIDTKKRAANQKAALDDYKKEVDKQNEEMDKLRLKNTQDEMKSATSTEEVEKLSAAKKVAIAQETLDKIKKLEAANQKQKEALHKEGINRDKQIDAQQAKMEEALNKEKDKKIQDEDDALNQEKLAALQNLENENASTAQKVGNVWAAESEKARMEMKDYTSLAQSSFSSVSSAADQAFESMGSGAESAGAAMKKFMFSSLGQIAEQNGAVMLLEGIWPPNPAALAGGAALLALGGFLSSQGGGSSSSSGVSIPSASSSTSTPNTTGQSTSPTSNQIGSSGPATTQTPSQSVSFTVQGNLYSSNEAKLEMMDIMRSATDATAFTYSQVGGGSN